MYFLTPPNDNRWLWPTANYYINSMIICYEKRLLSRLQIYSTGFQKPLYYIGKNVFISLCVLGWRTAKNTQRLFHPLKVLLYYQGKCGNIFLMTQEKDKNSGKKKSHFLGSSVKSNKSFFGLQDVAGVLKWPPLSTYQPAARVTMASIIMMKTRWVCLMLVDKH